MKLTCLLLTVLLLQIQTRTYCQSITWSGRNVDVERVFEEIKKQTGYFFFYSNNNLEGSHKVTIKVKNASLTKVLDKCSEGQPFDYVIEKNKTIVITKRMMNVEIPKPAGVREKDTMQLVSGK